MFNVAKFNIFFSASTKVCSDANKADTNRVCNMKKHEPTLSNCTTIKVQLLYLSTLWPEGLLV